MLRHTPVGALQGDPQVGIGGLTYDSRNVRPGDCFFAIRGTRSDGHDFIPMAVGKGAAAVVCGVVASALSKVMVHVILKDK